MPQEFVYPNWLFIPQTPGRFHKPNRSQVLLNKDTFLRIKQIYGKIKEEKPFFSLVRL